MQDAKWDALQNDCRATVELRAAAEAGDAEAAAACLAETVVLRSPITDRVVFEGRERVRMVLAQVFDVLGDIRYTADVGDQHLRALFYSATVGRRRLEEAMRLQLDDGGQITELTVFYRPLPGLARFAAALAPRVARSRGRSQVARLLLWPLAVATAGGDRLTPWLAGAAK